MSDGLLEAQLLEVCDPQLEEWLRERGYRTDVIVAWFSFYSAVNQDDSWGRETVIWPDQLPIQRFS